jgi:hypothetical protein
MNTECFKKIRKIISNNVTASLMESSEPCWNIHDSSWTDYNKTFAPLLDDYHNSIFELVDSFKKSKSSTRGLDLLGTGSALEGLEFNKGLGVALNYYNSGKLEQRKEEGINFIPGDIILPSTWKNIEKWIKKNGLFSVIFCRPVAAFYPDDHHPSLPKWASFYYRLLRQTYGVLDQGGILLSQVPSCCKAEYLPMVKDNLNGYFELTYTKECSAMMLKKTKLAGTQLPKQFPMQ